MVLRPQRPIESFGWENGDLFGILLGQPHRQLNGMFVPVFIPSQGAERLIFRQPAAQKRRPRLRQDHGIGHAMFRALAFLAKHGRISQQIVETLLHQDIGVEIDAAMLDKLLQADNIGLVRDMLQGTAKYLLGRFDLGERHQFPAQIPPRAARFELAMKINLLRPDPFDGASQAHMMDKAPRLTAEIAGHAEGIMQYFRNAGHGVPGRRRSMDTRALASVPASRTAAGIKANGTSARQVVIFMGQEPALQYCKVIPALIRLSAKFVPLTVELRPLWS